jgi:hypothetical protein
VDAGVDLRNGGELAAVAGSGALAVPPGADPDRRQPDQAGAGEQRRCDDRGAEDEHDGDAGDRDLGRGLADRPLQVVDVARRPGDQVAGARPLDRAEGEGDGAREEALAQLGEQLLAEHGRAQPGPPGQHDLDHERASEEQREPVDRRAGHALVDALHDVPQHGRPDEAERHRRGVHEQRRDDEPPVPPQHRRDVSAHLGGVGDREHGAGRAHFSSSRVTSER